MLPEKLALPYSWFLYLTIRSSSLLLVNMSIKKYCKFSTYNKPKNSYQKVGSDVNKVNNYVSYFNWSVFILRGNTFYI